jgi:hypothetical protein
MIGLKLWFGKSTMVNASKSGIAILGIDFVDIILTVLAVLIAQIFPAIQWQSNTGHGEHLSSRRSLLSWLLGHYLSCGCLSRLYYI